MKCFRSSNGDGNQESQVRKFTSDPSSSMTSTDQDTKKSGSGSNSKNVSDTSTDSMGKPQFTSFSQEPNDLRIFRFEELKIATRNFSRSRVLGEGGFGCVYRGTIKSPDSPNTNLDIAVKQLSRKCMPFQGHKQWLTEVNVLGVVEHSNLVKLIGYCADDGERGIQRLLVYEYMQNRSTEYHLSQRTSSPLSWSMRLKIAVDAARGLAYLHEGMDIQIIFRDFKTSNILLDEHWNAKLSDFGLARQGPAEGLTHVSTAVVGTIGYAAPEYVQTGRLSLKSDIWSYGVVLYELITGRRPIDQNRPKSEKKLLEWIKPFVSDAKKFHLILDPSIRGDCSLKSAMKLAAVANICLNRQPKLRPKMSEVLQKVQCVLHEDRDEVPNPSPEKSAVQRKGSRRADSKLFSRRWAAKLIRAT